MGIFLSDLILSPLPDGKQWRVINQLTWIAQDGFIADIPAGFISDLASVPQLFWSLLPSTGTYDRAALIHDYLYATQRIARADADKYLYEAMIDCGTSWIQRTVIYHQVRLWGWIAWNSDAKKKEATA